MTTSSTQQKCQTRKGGDAKHTSSGYPDPEMYSSSSLVSWQMAANWAGLIGTFKPHRLRFFIIGHSRVRKLGLDSRGPSKGDPPAYPT